MRMDVQELGRLKRKSDQFLRLFDDCFQRKDTRAHLPTYVSGQLSDLPQKSVEPIAIKAGVAPRTLQEFLSQHKWDEDRMCDRLHQLVATEEAGPNTIGIFDETSDVKKGDKTPGVQRQWCGSVGKKENCLVTVHLGYARDDFHCLLNGELYLPEDWSNNRERCREAGIPDDMVYRPKWQIALELYDHAVANGLHFDWMTFDEGYGSKPDFLRGLTARDQWFVGEVPRSFTGWLKSPRVTTRPFHKNGRGRGRKIPRLVGGSSPAKRVDELLNEAAVRDQPWQRWRVKDGEKGPMIWEVKHTLFSPKDEDGMPDKPLHLVIARNVMDPSEVKFFVSNAPASTPVQKLLLVGFSRWRVERCFEDQKGEIGLDHFEGRRYQGLKRHMILSCVSYLFLSRMRREFGKKKSGVDRVPSAYGAGGFDSELVVEPASLEEAPGPDCPRTAEDARTNCRSSQEPHQGDATKASRIRHQTHRSSTLLVGEDLAL
jgi:SRSO17 transposase